MSDEIISSEFVQPIEEDLFDSLASELKEVRKNFALYSEKDEIFNNPSIKIKHEKFWKDFLSMEFPDGKINTVLEKNFAIYIVQNNVKVEDIIQQYQRMHWDVKGLLGWIEKVKKGDLRKYFVGEIVEWCKEYKPEYVALLFDADDKVNIEPVKDSTILWDDELDSLKTGNNEWLVDGIIPQRSIGFWSGKRGTFKSWLLLHLCYCVASGVKFLDTYPVTQGTVIYLDKENGPAVMQERRKMIRMGMDLEEKYPVGFICQSELKFDSKISLDKIKELLETHKPSLIVVDTFRRAVSISEDKADEVSRLYTDTLQPLVDKYGVTIVLIHHNKKGESQGDEMDMLRGSSDLANMANFVMVNERTKKNEIIMHQLKMRRAKELEPVLIKLDTDEKTFIKFTSEGTYEPVTKETWCQRILIGWIIRKSIKNFTTKEAEEVAFEKGCKRRVFFNSLNLLQTDGYIRSNLKGHYEVDWDKLKEVIPQ